MADPIRKQILDELVTCFEALRGTDALWTSTTTVAIEALGFGEVGTRPGAMPFVGIIPQEEQVAEYPDHLLITWPIEIVGHVALATRTMDGVVEYCTKMRTDLRRIIYTHQELGAIEGVISISLVGMMGSEGATIAVEEGVASVILKINILFEEGILD